VITQPVSADNAPQEAEESHGSAQRRMQQWREIGIGAQILRDLGIVSIRLLAAHRRHYIGVSGFGIAIAETEILEP
jgi:3,4-dihydroxy 2-butanone 4-phosphate synthase/GTP cyclohydrolase II